MSRKLTAKFALVLALTLSATSSKSMQAQSGPSKTSPAIVTGGDPQPINPPTSILGTILPVLIAALTA